MFRLAQCTFPYLFWMKSDFVTSHRLLCQHRWAVEGLATSGSPGSAPFTVSSNLPTTVNLERRLVATGGTRHFPSLQHPHPPLPVQHQQGVHTAVASEGFPFTIRWACTPQRRQTTTATAPQPVNSPKIHSVVSSTIKIINRPLQTFTTFSANKG